VFIALVVLVGGTAFAAVSYYRWCQEASGPKDPVRVVIPEGASGSEIVSILHRQGVVRCDLVSKFLIRSNPRADRIRAGTYTLTTNMTLDEAVRILSTPPHRAQTVRLTIPPGLRLTQIADVIRKGFGIPPTRFLAVAGSGKFAIEPYLPSGTDTVEGFLWPETYQVVKDTATADSIIRMLLRQFRDEVRNLPWKNAGRLGLTPYEVVVVGSMIEEESARPGERSLISAVIYNRLEEGLPLGIDATLLYDDPTPGDNALTESDLESDSPYNTRNHVGLPPTPIASPQLASIRAALEPADVDYLYYVLCPKDGDGHHRFSVSYEEFLSNKNECLG
jgi:UPF0755 protein